MLSSHQQTLNANAKHCNAVFYNGIDIVKFVCSILVCSIHIAPFNSNTTSILAYFNFGVQQYIARIAVPFFFVCSGFFLFRKIDNSQNSGEVIQNYSLKLIRLLGLWSILLAHSLTYQLWYIGATVVAITIVGFSLKSNLRYGQLIAIATGLYILGLLGDSYYGLTAKLTQIKPIDYLSTTYAYFFTSTRNGLFMGVPFVLIGMLFARKKINLKTSVAVIGFLLSELFLFCEVLLLKYFDIPKNYNMYIFLIPSTVFLFAFASQIKIKDKPIYKKLRAAGSLIYFSHMLVYKFVYFGAIIIREITNIDLSSYLFWLTLILVVGLAFWIESLSRKERFKWLSWVYS